MAKALPILAKIANRRRSGTTSRKSSACCSAATLALAEARMTSRGRGIDAELGGDVRLTRSSRDPVAIGAFGMRRGRLSVVGQRLDFSRGRLTFGGELTAPDLDFMAETKAAEVSMQAQRLGSVAATRQA